MESSYEVKDVSSSFSKEEQDGLKRFLPANAYICPHAVIHQRGRVK